MIRPTVSREQLKFTFGLRLPCFILAVEIRTMRPLAVSFDIALFCLVVYRVVLLLLRTMRVLTSVLKLTSYPKCLEVCVFDPSFTGNLSVIRKKMWLATEVLPVVGILTLFSIVAFGVIVEWAPYCLKVEHVEVYVFLHQVEHVNAQFLICVGEGT